MSRDILYKTAPADWNGAAAGGWADGGCWIQSEIHEKIQILRPYAADTCTYSTIINYLHLNTTRFHNPAEEGTVKEY